jgi:hypothetical protein
MNNSVDNTDDIKGIEFMLNELNNVQVESWIMKRLMQIKSKSNSEATQNMVAELSAFISGNIETIKVKMAAFLIACCRDMTNISHILPILCHPELTDNRNAQCIGILVSAMEMSGLIKGDITNDVTSVMCTFNVSKDIQYTCPDGSIHITKGILGNSILKHFNNGLYHCDDVLRILGSIEFQWDKESWDKFPHMILLKEEAKDKDKVKSYLQYEKNFEDVIDCIPDTFHVPMKPDWRGRYYTQSDLGNYTGNKELRVLIKPKHMDSLREEYNLDVDDVDTSKFGI